MATKRVEDGIRAYLESLTAKPAKLGRVVDREAVKALTQQIRGESDPVNKLRLYAAREEARKGSEPQASDNNGLEAVFVAEAKAWADSEGIPVDAFLALKVPGEVLKRAGFTINVSVPTTVRSSSGTRAPRLPIEDVKVAVAQLGAEWKLSDLAEKIGRDTATARNYLNRLVDSGDVKIVGDDPNHNSRGRAAKLYAAR